MKLIYLNETHHCCTMNLEEIQRRYEVLILMGVLSFDFVGSHAVIQMRSAERDGCFEETDNCCVIRKIE